MSKVIETIRSQGVPLSANHAAQYLGKSEQGIGVLSDAEYIKRIHAITDTTVSYTDSDMYRLSYSYLCVEAIKASDTTDILNANELLTIAEEKAKVLKSEQPWCFAKGDEEPKLDDDGNVKQKKGAKKYLAMEVYKEFIKDIVTARKDAIAILVDKVGLTPAGASTYYANLKKHNGVL